MGVGDDPFGSGEDPLGSDVDIFSSGAHRAVIDGDNSVSLEDGIIRIEFYLPKREKTVSFTVKIDFSVSIGSEEQKRKVDYERTANFFVTLLPYPKFFLYGSKDDGSYSIPELMECDKDLEFTLSVENNGDKFSKCVIDSIYLTQKGDNRVLQEILNSCNEKLSTKVPSEVGKGERKSFSVSMLFSEKLKFGDYPIYINFRVEFFCINYGFYKPKH